jgi:WhiB family redox-sensing transcriptional regulator
VTGTRATFAAIYAPTGAWASHPDRACRKVDPDLFFADKTDHARAAKAKKVCRPCPVVDACRDYAVSIPGLDGVWGATTPTDRVNIRHAARTSESAPQRSVRLHNVAQARDITLQCVGCDKLIDKPWPSQRFCTRHCRDRDRYRRRQAAGLPRAPQPSRRREGAA